MSIYNAPWSKSLALTTCGFSIALVGISVALFYAGLWFIAPIPLAIPAFLALFIVRGYSITPDAVLIHRTFWFTRLEINALQSVWIDPNAMEKSTRTGGVDGMFVTTGYFSNEKLGDFRTFVTDPKFGDFEIIIRNGSSFSR